MAAIEVHELMTSEQLANAIAALHRHYADVVVPIWRNRGFDPVLRLPLEAVLTDTAPASQRFRAMACARQLYIFSEFGDRAHADRLFDSLVGYFRDRQHGGFFYSILPTGEPLDTDKDLYTHAFVIFACAAYLSRFNVDAARSVLGETTDIVMSRFSKDPSTGLPNAAVSADFASIHIGARQNPLMHLTEAYLLARQASEDSVYDSALDALLGGVAKHFVDRNSGCIMELPSHDPQSWIEPGHQFEWYFLCAQSGHPGFDRSGLRDALAKAFTFAQTHGVDPLNGGVAASLDREGKVLDGTQRIWAQTEYLRALAYRQEADPQAALETQIKHFQARFLHADGWHECLSPDSRIARNDMPSTTPYHLASAYAALHERHGQRSPKTT